MSRIASYPIAVPAWVEAVVGDSDISVRGPVGGLVQRLISNVVIRLDGGHLSFEQTAESHEAAAMAGIMRWLVNNMVIGVNSGFERKLSWVGVGFRAQMQGSTLRLQLGFSHDVLYPVPEGITIECPTATEIVVKGINKQVVGQVAAEISAFRRPEPYNGKGVRYADETVVMKEAKKK